MNLKTIASILVALLAIQTSAFACSAFLLKGEDYQVIGFNENWKHLPGMVVVMGGHLRTFFGQVYLTDLLPVGVQPQDLR